MKNFMKTIQIEDPRQQHKSKTYVTGCNWLVLIATLAGADTLVDIEFLVNAMQRH